MLRVALVLSLVCAPAARAELHLLTQDAPAAAPLDAPTAAPAAPADQPSVAPVAAPAPAPTPAPAEAHGFLAERPAPQWWLQAGAGLGAGLIATPVTLYLCEWLGTLSNNVYVVLVPALLVMAALPSLAVTAAVVGLGNLLSPGRYPFFRVWGVTALANIAALVVAGFLQVNVGFFGSILAFALADALVMTGVATPVSRLLENPHPGEAPKNVISSLAPWDAGGEKRWFVATTEVKF